RAGAQSWERFPYYARRFGERGRTFTDRDSLWLAGLAARPEGDLPAQVEWLGGVLAARGMPRWLLECHLEVLYRELDRLAPGGGGGHGPGGPGSRGRVRTQPPAPGTVGPNRLPLANLRIMKSPHRAVCAGVCEPAPSPAGAHPAGASPAALFPTANRFVNRSR